MALRRTFNRKYCRREPVGIKWRHTRRIAQPLRIWAPLRLLTHISQRLSFPASRTRATRAAASISTHLHTHLPHTPKHHTTPAYLPPYFIRSEPLASASCRILRAWPCTYRRSTRYTPVATFCIAEPRPPAYRHLPALPRARLEDSPITSHTVTCSGRLPAAAAAPRAILQRAPNWRRNNNISAILDAAVGSRRAYGRQTGRDDGTHLLARPYHQRSRGGGAFGRKKKKKKKKRQHFYTSSPALSSSLHAI